MVTDIYEGELLTVWRDEDFVYFSFPGVTISVPHGEDFNSILHDLDKFVHTLLDKDDSDDDIWKDLLNKKWGERN
mgnify:FL=1